MCNFSKLVLVGKTTKGICPLKFPIQFKWFLEEILRIFFFVPQDEKEGEGGGNKEKMEYYKKKRTYVNMCAPT